MLTDKELAIACKEAGQCRFCKPDVKAQCLHNECWKATYPKDNMPPSVYYGLVPQTPSSNPEEDEAWRKRWFEKHGIPFQSQRPIKRIFALKN